MKLGTVLLVVALVALLIGAGYFSLSIWTSIGDVEMSGHGWTALVLGIVFSIALGGGLMFLVFYSHRKGYDQSDES